jgi:hypothetical protein
MCLVEHAKGRDHVQAEQSMLKMDFTGMLEEELMVELS